MAASGRGPAAALPLVPELMARWGIGYDAARGVLTLAPRLVSGERRAACPPFRAGRTVVALEFRSRPDAATLRVMVRFGPPVRVEAWLPDRPAATHVQVDDVPVHGPRVAFEARGEHEVAWLG